MVSDLNFRVTGKQVGNGIGALLASIGIPLAIEAVKKLTGKGVKGGSSMRIGKGSPRIGRPPPFIGSWEGRGKKKDIPMSNFDLLDWSKYLKIPINNVLSRDRQVPHNHKEALFIYNLEPSYMNGSHWVSTYIRDNVVNYFDSFGLPPFQEIVDHAKRKNLTLLHQNRQIQHLNTTTCGYFCLYFLNEMHKGVDYFDLLQVFSFDTMENEKFIEKYFTNIEKN